MEKFGVFLLSLAFHAKYLWYKFSEILGQALISTRFISLSIPEYVLLGFFKVNDPFRLLVVALYLLVVAVISLVVFPTGITHPLLSYLVLGERLGEGYVLYGDVIEDIGPLAAGVFAGMNWLFGRSVLAYEILGRVLIFLQILYWNTVLLRYRVFQDNTYLPAIVMAALFQLSFDLSLLTPQLLGSTFLILALGQLFSLTVLQKESSESTLLIGLYGGIAAGFHLSYLIFLPYLLLTGIAISGFSFRQVMLSLMGFLVPILLMFVFFYWKDSLADAFSILPFLFTYDKYRFLNLTTLILFLVIPGILGLLGFLFSVFFKGSSINQQKQRQLIILWLIFGLAELLLIKRQAPYQLGIFFPGLTYLITAFFVSGGKNLAIKLCFGLLLIGLPVGGWLFWSSDQAESSGYFVQTPSGNPPVSGQKILVWDDQLGYYQTNQLGGPFLNSHLSKDYLEQNLSLWEKSRIYSSFANQRPTVVIDQSGGFRNFLIQFPAIHAWYDEREPGYYFLK